MNDLIIDATTNKIFLTIIKDTKNIYTSKFENSKNNFDKLIILIEDLLNKNKLLIKDLNRIYVNRGPGSFAGIRSSISIAKGYHISQNIDYYCFSFLDFISSKISNKNQISKNSILLSQYHNIKYEKIPELCNKYKIKKNLIKPLYLS
ncbi:MAG: tRNA (adenosine(37)-N6)-threonylcarbamoyltransferase complex dimerization subunit type 1 TsaB [Candidatus Pelagibacter sp.]